MIGLRRITNTINDYGDFTEVYDIDVLIDALEKIFGIMIETYPFDPVFGSNLFRYIYEPFDEITMENVENDVRSVMNQHIPGLKLLSLSISMANDKSFILDLFVQFQGIKKTAKFLFDRSGYVSLIKDD